MNRYMDAFMKTFPHEGLTYDDVTLVTQYADFLPDETSLETKLTSRLMMKTPFISAAMDTVTAAPMALLTDQKMPSVFEVIAQEATTTVPSELTPIWITIFEMENIPACSPDGTPIRNMPDR